MTPWTALNAITRAALAIHNPLTDEQGAALAGAVMDAEASERAGGWPEKARRWLRAYNESNPWQARALARDVATRRMERTA